MIKRTSFILLLTLCVQFHSFADEGMWLPMLIKRLNYTDMQKLGLKLTPEEIYSVNNSSLKDAIVNFGGFCTGEMISKDGLLLTNHHCGLESVQSQSSVENDLLSNGYWAKTRDKELPAAGLTVTFLVRMENVTEEVLKAKQSGMPAQDIEAKIEEISNALAAKSVEGTHYNAEVKSFFEGNEYYLFVYETFKDVRLAGVPPSSIGKFGGDTDNWMWPRHTGDFSMFRVYTGPDGKPAEYSAANIPLKPKHYLPVSLKGLQKNDYAMVMGFPGNTERYLTSEGVKLALDQTNPARIKIREKRLSLMKEDMEKDPKVRIQYASNYAQVSNYYKYFIGQNQGLKRLRVVEKKQKQEQEFQKWANSDPNRKKEYGNVINDFSTIYQNFRKVNLSYTYLEEAAFGVDVLMFAYKLSSYVEALATNTNLPAATEEARKMADEHFKNYNASTDQKIFAALLQMYYTDIDKSFHPAVFKEVEKKYKGNFEKYAADVFKKSLLVNQAKFNAFLAKPDVKTLAKDPAYKAMGSILNDFRSQAGPFLGEVYGKLDEANSLYTKGIMDMRKDAKLYPNANSTMRITYGTVQDYFPKDAVYYNYFTTLDGIIEKEDSTNEEFIVPAKLKELYNKKDYGRYSVNGTVPVCFITNNDITGGNSGSPVIDGEGNLVGCAFDGNWEAMSGDIAYEPELQRCISVDIRYVLFIIDKFAGATNLIEEMTIVESPAKVLPKTQPIGGQKKLEPAY